MEETLVNFMNLSGIAWWVKISTLNPRCTYYFGPFLTSEEAKAAEAGYLEDLEAEGAEGIQVHIQQCQPVELTIYDDELESSGDQVMVNPVFN
ncbi:hypothetical protein AFK68_25385 [Hydrocoleum sp. CS-953]|nr:DUF1816 domain-containing protein [Hydrocoleum sp. CS-953]OZH52278.1 hypothetical protein AFK68_25385 [Hydrocoleum sp. CS-953]